MQRGGKRPGSGAKQGNLNALKHGRHSQKLSKLADEVGSFVFLGKDGQLRVYEKKKKGE